MDGVHDMGGMHGFGPIEAEENEPTFHAAWEGRVLAICFGTRVRVPGGFRNNIEKLDPAFYLASSYYEKWLHARIKGLIDAGAITKDELESAIERCASRPGAPVPTRGVEEAKEQSGESPRAVQRKSGEASEPQYKVGDRVRARNTHPAGHTRLPRYIRGKVGEVIRTYRRQGFQDAEPMSDHDGPQPVYAVRFDGTEVWGESAEPNSSVCLDMWEAYLQPA